jgi:ubiquinone/menaquinone biosynthesis C-methylase UbiE
MGLYARFVLPGLIDLAMRQPAIHEYRRRVAPAASGRVLEIGVGSGLNLPLYQSGVSEVIGIDPSDRLLERAKRRAAGAAAPVSLRRGTATALDVADASIDTLVMTWTLCSIPDPLAALREMRRVLKPGGRLLFVEHGLSPDAGVARWQHRLTPLWRRLAGGCHLDRPIGDLMRTAGFDLPELETGYAPGPRPTGYMYEGRAVHSG